MGMEEGGEEQRVCDSAYLLAFAERLLHRGIGCLVHGLRAVNKEQVGRSKIESRK